MKVVTLISVVLLGILAIARSDPVGECPASDGAYPVLLPSEDCTSFYICSHGVPNNIPCPDGLLFNVKNNVCDWPDRVDCDNEPPEECLAD